MLIVHVNVLLQCISSNANTWWQLIKKSMATLICCQLMMYQL